MERIHEALGDQFKIVPEPDHEGWEDAGRIVAYKGDEVAGELEYHVSESYFPERTLHPDHLEVAEPYRGRGIATELHNTVLDMHPELPMTHSTEGMSDDARRALSRWQSARPGRHKIFDDTRKTYL